MTKLFTNFAASKIVSPIGTLDTNISLIPGDGGKFPLPQTNDTFTGVLVKITGEREIVTATARSVDTIAIVRGQENTPPLSFIAGDRFEHRLTAGDIQSLVDSTEIATEQADAAVISAAGAVQNVSDALAAMPPAVLIAGTQTVIGNKEFSGKTTLGNYKEAFIQVPDSTVSYVVDCSGATIRKIVLTSNCTITMANVPAGVNFAFNLTLALMQDGVGSRSVVWPASVRWGNGVAPILSLGANKTDFVSLLTFDGGSSWYGFVSGQNY